MKPKPLASLNHFTVPVVRIPLLLLGCCNRSAGSGTDRLQSRVVFAPTRALFPPDGHSTATACEGCKKGPAIAGPEFFPGTCALCAIIAAVKIVQGRKFGNGAGTRSLAIGYRPPAIDRQPIADDRYPQCLSHCRPVAPA